MKRILSMLLVAATVISMMMVAVPASAEEATSVPENYNIGVETFLGKLSNLSGNIAALRENGLFLRAYGQENNNRNGSGKSLEGLKAGFLVPLDSVGEATDYDITFTANSMRAGAGPYMFYGFGKNENQALNADELCSTMIGNTAKHKIQFATGGLKYCKQGGMSISQDTSEASKALTKIIANVAVGGSTNYNSEITSLGDAVTYKFSVKNNNLVTVTISSGDYSVTCDIDDVAIAGNNKDYFGIVLRMDTYTQTDVLDFLITDIKITSNEETKYEVDFVKTYAAISTVSASAPRAEYAQMSDDGTSVRFVAGVTMTEDIMSQFTEVGFDVVKVEGNNTTHKLTSQKLYTSIRADTMDVSAKELEADYVSAMSVDGLSKTQTYGFAVRGFLKDKFGNIFAGDTNYFEVVNGEISTSTPAEEDIFTTVKVGTYNLHEGGYYELGDSGREAPDFTKIAEDIKDLDVVAFQEIYCNTKGVYGQDPLAIMEEYLERENGCEYYSAYGVATTVNYEIAYPEYNIEAGDVGRLGVGIISKYPIKKTNEYKMTVNNSENNCVLLEAIIDVNGTELAFYSTHNDQSAIDVQLSEIYTQAKNYSRYIVAGDFNYQTWTGFDAAFPDANKVNNADTNIVTTTADQMFDNIIYSGFTKLSGTAKAINTGNSDHYLLTAEIKVLK